MVNGTYECPECSNRSESTQEKTKSFPVWVFTCILAFLWQIKLGIMLGIGCEISGADIIECFADMIAIVIPQIMDIFRASIVTKFVQNKTSLDLHIRWHFLGIQFWFQSWSLQRFLLQHSTKQITLFAIHTKHVLRLSNSSSCTNAEM